MDWGTCFEAEDCAARPFEIAAGEALAHVGGGCELAAERLGQRHLLAEGLEVAADRLQRQTADRVGDVAELLEVDDRERAHSDRHPVGADQGEAILRPERAWGNAGASGEIGPTSSITRLTTPRAGRPVITLVTTVESSPVGSMSKTGASAPGTAGMEVFSSCSFGRAVTIVWPLSVSSQTG